MSNSLLKFTAETVLKEMQCGTCGVWHALPEKMYDKCFEEGGFWHCPNGHSRGFDKGSLRKENERLSAELESVKKRKEWAEQEAKNADARAVAAKGQLTKLRKRVANGVCPLLQAVVY